MKLIAILLTFTLSALGASVVTYPDPGLAANSTAAQQSTFWQVDCVTGGVTNNSFAYQILAQKLDTNPWTNSTFTTFSSSGSITVNVTKLFSGNVTNCSIYPTSYGITATVDSTTKAHFTMPDPGTGKHCAVIFDGDWSHPLYVFAEPLETSPPTTGSSTVIYFSAPGVYNLGTNCLLSAPNNSTIYIAGGAYVMGKIWCNGSTGVTIRGRGIISGENFTSPQPAPVNVNSPLVSYMSTTNFTFEGLTLIQPPFFCTRADSLCTNDLVKNVKMFGWLFHSDGVNIPSYSTNQDNFYAVNDDTIKAYFGGGLEQRSVIVKPDNAAVFQIRRGLSVGNQASTVISNIDVIKTAWPANSSARAVFSAIATGTTAQSGYTLDSIRVENAQNKLFDISLADSSASLHDFTFSNLTVTNSSFANGNLLTGFDATHLLYNFTFGPSFYLNGVHVTNSTSGNFTLSNTSNIVYTP